MAKACPELLALDKKTGDPVELLAEVLTALQVPFIRPQLPNPNPQNDRVVYNLNGMYLDPFIEPNSIIIDQEIEPGLHQLFMMERLSKIDGISLRTQISRFERVPKDKYFWKNKKVPEFDEKTTIYSTTDITHTAEIDPHSAMFFGGDAKKYPLKWKGPGQLHVELSQGGFGDRNNLRISFYNRGQRESGESRLTCDFRNLVTAEYEPEEHVSVGNGLMTIRKKRMISRSDACDIRIQPDGEMKPYGWTMKGDIYVWNF